MTTRIWVDGVEILHSRSSGRKEENKELFFIGLKRCFECKRIFPIEQFPKDNSYINSPGRSGWCFDCNGRYHREWRNKDRDRVNSYSKKYYQNNKEKVREHGKELAKLYKPRRKELDDKSREKRTNSARIRNIERRLKCIKHYSNGKNICACCGDGHYEFLCIDHVNGGGMVHRKEVGGSGIYYWLISNNFPGGFRVLCHNCNLSLGFYGYCPHEKAAAKRAIAQEPWPGG